MNLNCNQVFSSFTDKLSMKKNILILVAILFPLVTSQAQIRTGGGSDVPADDTVQAANYYLGVLSVRLVERDAICAPEARKMKDADLMQAYLKLSLLKNVKSSSEQCDEVNKYFACIADGKTQRYAHKIKLNTHSVGQLKIKYKISDDEAINLIKFFDELSEKIK